MQRTITMTTPDGKSTTKTFNVRDLAHLEACQKFHATTTKNKKKYSRKEKYKKNYADGSY